MGEDYDFGDSFEIHADWSLACKRRKIAQAPRQKSVRGQQMCSMKARRKKPVTLPTPEHPAIKKLLEEND